MYQALYRKWRPKTFSDVVGQDHITQTLQRQVAEGRLSHAYLFTGTRGTGKTTCAKILAKAVNCEHPVDGDPCNECPACRGIDSGSLLDVLELDAASNNGVDHVRALRDEAIYSPAHVKYRVYIVDEVHMLSTAAFNALLKILEEPPAHLIFILATTELHKVPATILSRCQRFAFKRLQPRDIAERLLYVARQENIDLVESGAGLLARLADGALRDALSLLDQCAAVGGVIDADKVLEVIGLAGHIQTARMMTHILQRDARSAIVLLDELYGNGKDVGAVLGELSALARDLLIYMTARSGGEALLSGAYDDATLEGLAALCTPQRLIHVTTLLQATTAGLAASSNRRTDAELCLLRLCDDSLSGDITALAARVSRLEDALAGGNGMAGTPASPAKRASARPAAPRAARQEAPPPADDIPWEEPPLNPQRVDDAPRDAAPFPTGPIEAEAPRATGEQSASRETSAPAAPCTPAVEETRLWEHLINDYKSRLPVMYRVFLDSAHGALQGDQLIVTCDSDFTKTQLHNVKVQSVLQEVTSSATGRSIAVVFQVGQVEQPPATGGEPSGGSVDKMDDLIDFGSQFDNFKIK